MIRLLVFCCCLPLLAGAYSLTEKNSAIIIPDRPNSVERMAATELQYHLRKASGVTLPIVGEGHRGAAVTGGFVLGRNPVVALPETEILDTYELRFRDNFLYITGRDGGGKEEDPNTAAGTLSGVYLYLSRELGVRWLWPGESGEVISTRKTVELNDKQDGVYRPKLLFARATSLAKDPEKFRWSRRVMHQSSVRLPVHAVTGGHAFEKWAAKYGAEHPDWFALRPDGERHTRPNGGMCVSNAGFQDEIVRLWHEAQRKNPQVKRFINVKENDTQSRCNCDNCRSWDGDDLRGPTGRYALYRNVGERYGRFYRSVLDRAVKFDPDAKVSFLAYQSYFYAPRKTVLGPGCWVGLVPDIPFPRRSEYDRWLRDEYRAWQASGAVMYLRPNYFLSGYCMPEVWYDQYADEFKFLRELGCVGLNIDGPSNMWATRGLDYYVMGRLCTDPEADPEALAGEYYTGFGAASEDVKTYFEFYRDYLKTNTLRINKIYEKSANKWYFHGFNYAVYAHKTFPPATLEQGRRFLDAAAKKVADDPAASVKVDFLRQGLEYAIASVRCAELFDTPDVTAEARKQAWDDLYRRRETLPPHAVNPVYLDRIEKRVWQVVTLNRKDAQALPEYWQIKADPKDTGKRDGYMKPGFDTSSWERASTWKHLEHQGISDYRNMWYRTTTHMAEKSSERVILQLGGVDESCEVWVNGQAAGSFRYDAKKDPESWKKPLEFDITSLIKFGSDNLLCVKVENLSGNGGLWKPSCLIFRGKEK